MLFNDFTIINMYMAYYRVLIFINFDELCEKFVNSASFWRNCGCVDVEHLVPGERERAGDVCVLGELVVRARREGRGDDRVLLRAGHEGAGMPTDVSIESEPPNFDGSSAGVTSEVVSGRWIGRLLDDGSRNRSGSGSRRGVVSATTGSTSGLGFDRRRRRAM